MYCVEMKGTQREREREENKTKKENVEYYLIYNTHKAGYLSRVPNARVHSKWWKTR